MANKVYNPDTGLYEDVTKSALPNATQVPGSGGDIGRSGQPELNTGQLPSQPTGTDYQGNPTPTIGEWGIPNVDYYVGAPENMSNKWLPRYEELYASIPGTFGGGGGGRAESLLEQQSIEDVGRSDRYGAFSEALNESMLASIDPANSPYSQSVLNVQTGDVNRQFSQVRDQISARASSEGWMGTPKYDKAIKDAELQNVILNQNNRNQYRTAEANWGLANKQIINDYYEKYTNAEDKNREIKMQEGKINADFAWDASKEKARIAAARASAARSARSQMLGMQVSLLDKMFSIDDSERRYQQEETWNMFDARINRSALEIGAEQSEAEMEAAAAEAGARWF